METSFASLPFNFRKIVSAGTALAMVGLSGCSSVAPSKTTSGAGTGAMIGGAGGALVGSNSSMGTGTGLVGGAAAGALIGGLVGMVQDAKDRKEQDRLAQERAYQQEMAKKRAQEAKLKASMDEELAIAEGFRISDLELTDAQKKFEQAQERLKGLQAERTAALSKKKALDDAQEKTITTEAEIARLEEELARLKGEDFATKAAGADEVERRNDVPAASKTSAPAPAPTRAKTGI